MATYLLPTCCPLLFRQKLNKVTSTSICILLCLGDFTLLAYQCAFDTGITRSFPKHFTVSTNNSTPLRHDRRYPRIGEKMCEIRLWLTPPENRSLVSKLLSPRSFLLSGDTIDRAKHKLDPESVDPDCFEVERLRLQPPPTA